MPHRTPRLQVRNIARETTQIRASRKAALAAVRRALAKGASQNFKSRTDNLTPLQLGGMPKPPKPMPFSKPKKPGIHYLGGSGL